MKTVAIIVYLAFTILNLMTISSARAVVGTGQINVTFIQPEGHGITASGTGESLVSTIIKNVIFLFFAVGGLGTIVYFLWGAVDWVLSGGDKEKVASARKKMTHALIGLTLLALSFVIISVVGRIVGFNPLGSLQIRGLGNKEDFVPNR